MAAGPEWRDFERLMAAIHRVAHAGASVQWNEIVRGRQFDVTVSFKHGLYEYLTVVECRNRNRPVTAENVDALVTKSRDAGADRAILASSSTFQSGAVKVAIRHKVDLIRVTKNEDYLETLLGPPSLVNHVASIKLLYKDGKRCEIPSAGNAMDYYVKHVRIGFENASRSLGDIIAKNVASLPEGMIGEYSNVTIDLPEGCRTLKPRDDGYIILDTVSAVEVRYGLVQGRPIVSDVMFEASLLKPDIELSNIVTGRRDLFPQMGLPMGIETILEPGKYYHNPNLGFYYYCNSVVEDKTEMWLVESFQCGRLVRAIFQGSKKYSDHYVEVTDASTLKRLRKRMARMRENRDTANSDFASL